MKRVARRTAAASVVLATLGGAVAGGLQAAPVFQPCRLEDSSRLQAFEAQCTTLTVPENPAQPGGAKLQLFVARVPAISRRKAPDPLFLLAGGPGMGASTMYPQIARALRQIGRTRDLVIVDQRGTGRSTSLACALSDDTLLEGGAAKIAAATRECLAQLQPRRDVTEYTTSVAVQDLDRVRRALGYAQINLYGVSYGTRVAQHYLRRFPASTRAVILDGVVPPGLALGPDMAVNAENALTSIFQRCAADPACHRAFGDLPAHYLSLRARLQRKPETIELPDPSSGARRKLRFGAAHLGGVLRLQSYASSQAALLPFALFAAAERDDFLPLAALFLMTDDGLRDALAYGMHNSVICSEDIPFVDAARIDRDRLAATYMGTEQIDGLQSICSVWPRGKIDADFREPLKSSAPVLLLSGGADPVTPPANAVKAMAGLTNARHLVLPGAGHGQIGVACMDRVLADFLRDAAPAKLNAQCLERVRPEPFFTSAAGPAP